jgi:quinoprotein glucose dehydrogenase
MRPGIVGGANWGGGAYDPVSGILFVRSTNSPALAKLVPDADAKYLMGAGGGTTFHNGIPLLKPPYAHLTAIDLNKGEIVWQVAHGDTPDNIRNHPALQGMNIPRTGRPGQAGTLVTKTLLVAGEKGVVTMADGRRGAYLRAYNKATGADAGKVYIPAPQSGSPMTYMLNGKQYIVVAISGQGYNAELVAFALPANN